MAWGILAKYNLVLEMNLFWSELFHHLMPIFATYVLFNLGKPYLLGVYRFLRYGKANMDTLIGIGTSVAFIYSFFVSVFEETVLKNFPNAIHSYYDITIIVIIFIVLGKYLEARSKIKTGDAIEKLLNLQAKAALVIREEKEIEILLDEVIHGDIVIIKPGAKIPVDGVVLDGESYIDESMISGESMPIHKKIGDGVLAGTINENGYFIFRTTKIGSETLLAHIIKMVENAQGSKAPIQNLADKISSFFVPIVLFISFLSFILWFLLGSGPLGFSLALSYGLISFVSVLVIACPCALGLATPTAIIVGVGKGAREGILIKDASTLQKLHEINVVVVDKTGTITKGKPEVTDVENLSEKQIAILSSLEKKSEHPISQAILLYSKNKKLDFLTVLDFENIKGKGVKGKIDGVEYFAGSILLIEELKLSFDRNKLEKYLVQGKTPIILATKENVLGFVLVSNALKKESKKAVNDLHKLGIKVIMATGDNEQTALYIAKQVGIDEVFAQVMPEDKLNKIKELQKNGKIVGMVGDGVNDAPALAQANVGIAMATGTDVAIESAGITLLQGDISKLVKAIRLSRITMRVIKQNLFWAFIYNVVGIPLASGIFFPFFSWFLNPIFAGFAMALSSVSVVSNSLRIKTKKL